MFKAQVFNTSPKFPFKDQLSDDGMSLIISLLDGYRLPYNTNIAIELYGVNYSSRMPLIGGASCYPPDPARYSFRTKAR